jgi:hypothetical protein
MAIETGKKNDIAKIPQEEVDQLRMTGGGGGDRGARDRPRIWRMAETVDGEIGGGNIHRERT